MTISGSQEIEPSDPKEYIHVYTAYGQLAGEMIRLLLNSMDIPAVLSQESAGLAMGLTVGSLGEVKVLVPAENVNEAKKILQEMDEGKLVTDINLERLASVGPRYKNNKLFREEIFKEQDP